MFPRHFKIVQFRLWSPPEGPPFICLPVWLVVAGLALTHTHAHTHSWLWDCVSNVCSGRVKLRLHVRSLTGVMDWTQNRKIFRPALRCCTALRIVEHLQDYVLVCAIISPPVILSHGSCSHTAQVWNLKHSFFTSCPFSGSTDIYVPHISLPLCRFVQTDGGSEALSHGCLCAYVPPWACVLADWPVQCVTVSWFLWSLSHSFFSPGLCCLHIFQFIAKTVPAECQLMCFSAVNTHTYAHAHTHPC